MADVVVDGGLVPAVSGEAGAFAVPAFIPSDSAPVAITGSRWDLGVTGSVSAIVPSADNTLRLATVPFRILNTVPTQGETVSAGAVAMVMFSTPVDAATITGAKLLKETAPADGTGTGPASLVEIAVRRALSQDGKTLLLTPENPLDLGSAYHLAASGLASPAGEIAGAVDARFATAAVAVQPPVDVTGITLAYPDEAFNVAITIPEGAIPPLAAIEIEAPAMGSVYGGFMPASGNLNLSLKASLGERLKIRVQLKDGRVFEAFLSRYQSTDGSGRVTVGVDGGRVEAIDGSGAAVTLPVGAVDHPV